MQKTVCEEWVKLHGNCDQNLLLLLGLNFIYGFTSGMPFVCNSSRIIHSPLIDFSKEQSSQSPGWFSLNEWLGTLCETSSWFVCDAKYWSVILRTGCIFTKCCQFYFSCSLWLSLTIAFTVLTECRFPAAEDNFKREAQPSFVKDF